ncbi:ClpXP protease specificity-enhancing factor [Alkanindiges hydrocarboniclasticus]|jgi:stringent starvation protein B|uniref:ClpXP protease specificity-enhancing factor n=1 Tax=Alkanindiges hydrocarboniclasticus TaxID=1907941 RepID=A0A1S8CZ82_9GAMM|nr:ClpXP protease specificity-enhancing factor [Alkanindiges hydrocarboniclasticus]ONG41781.1 ClpXP protease specificity-enhancing factor [Alkanindiges hydrocarboniclasticus]
MSTEMIPTRPYLLRAIYEWTNDNKLTPYLLVNAELPNVQVPRQHVQDGQIVLNIAPHAVHHMMMDNDAVSFSARFGGVSQQLYVPMAAVLGLYARENGQGLFFDPQEYEGYQASSDSSQPQPDISATENTDNTAETTAAKKPSLRILD